MLIQTLIKKAIKNKNIPALLSASFFMTIILLPNISYADSIGKAYFNGILLQEAEFDVTGFQQNVDQATSVANVRGGGSGFAKADFGTSFIGLEVSGDIPTLFFICASGSSLNNVVIDLNNGLKITLTDARVVSVDLNVSMLSVGLIFAQIQWEFGVYSRGWDVRANKALNGNE